MLGWASESRSGRPDPLSSFIFGVVFILAVLTSWMVIYWGLASLTKAGGLQVEHLKPDPRGTGGPIRRLMSSAEVRGNEP